MIRRHREPAPRRIPRGWVWFDEPIEVSFWSRAAGTTWRRGKVVAIYQGGNFQVGVHLRGEAQPFRYFVCLLRREGKFWRRAGAAK